MTARVEPSGPAPRGSAASGLDNVGRVVDIGGPRHGPGPLRQARDRSPRSPRRRWRTIHDATNPGRRAAPDQTGPGRMIETDGLTKRYGTVPGCPRTCRWRSARGRSSGCSGRTARARRRRSGCCSGCSGRPRAGPHRGVRLLAESLEVRRRVSYLPGELRLPGGMRGLELLGTSATSGAASGWIGRWPSPSGSCSWTSGDGSGPSRPA